MIFGDTATPTHLTPAQSAEHDRLKSIWIATVDPAKKDAAYKALVAFDATLPPPPPPPAPNIAKRNSLDFLTQNRTTLLVVGGLALAGGFGFWFYKRRARR